MNCSVEIAPALGLLPQPVRFSDSIVRKCDLIALEECHVAEGRIPGIQKSLRNNIHVEINRLTEVLSGESLKVLPRIPTHRNVPSNLVSFRYQAFTQHTSDSNSLRTVNCCKTTNFTCYTIPTSVSARMLFSRGTFDSHGLEEENFVCIYVQKPLPPQFPV